MRANLPEEIYELLGKLINDHDYYKIADLFSDRARSFAPFLVGFAFLADQRSDFANGISDGNFRNSGAWLPIWKNQQLYPDAQTSLRICRDKRQTSFISSMRAFINRSFDK